MIHFVRLFDFAANFESSLAVERQKSRRRRRRKKPLADPKSNKLSRNKLAAFNFR